MPRRRGNGKSRSAARLTGATALFLLIAGGAQAQPGGPASLRALTTGFETLGEAATLRAAAIDAPSLAAAASAATAGGIGPVRFASPFRARASPGSHGEWRAAPDGGARVWRLRVVSEGAVSLNLGFTRYRMPPGGRLFVYAPGFGEVLGPYTEADNESHGELWTPILPGGEVVIVASVPADRAGELELQLGSVNRGFRDPGDVTGRGHKSCHVNVACSEADPYRDQVRSVGTYSLGGQDTCSGVLLNNTAGDGKLYFLTARHCFQHLENNGLTKAQIAASAVVYWNDETSACSGSTARFDPRQSQSGAHFLASWGAGRTDVLLMELDDPPDPLHNLYLAGWDRERPASGPSASIHHPMSHFKSISVSNGVPRPTTDRYEDTFKENGDYLRVGWDVGTVERGSSGSPLFNADKRVIGQLSVAKTDCEPGRAAWYGRFGNSWELLRRWLDPGGTGAGAIDGRDWNRAPETVGALDELALKYPGR